MGGAKRGHDAVWIRRQVFAIRPVVRVYISCRYKSDTNCRGPDFCVIADTMTKNLAVQKVHANRHCVLAQLAHGGTIDGVDGIVKIAAGVDVALFLGILLAADDLLYGGLQ